MNIKIIIISVLAFTVQSVWAHDPVVESIPKLKNKNYSVMAITAEPQARTVPYHTKTVAQRLSVQTTAHEQVHLNHHKSPQYELHDQDETRKAASWRLLRW